MPPKQRRLGLFSQHCQEIGSSPGLITRSARRDREILCSPRNAMAGDGVRPHDEKLNVLGGQRVQHLGEVAIDPKDFR